MNNGNRDVEMLPFQQQQPRSISRQFSRQESADQRHMRHIFSKYDRNNDGYLDRQELGNLIRERPNQCQEVPDGFCQQIRNYDVNFDGKLSFEEFYKMCKEHRWLIKGWCVKYCSLIVPPRSAPVQQLAAYTATYDEPDSYTVDEYYGSHIKFCPPPITMILFSIIEVCFFIVDIVHFKDYDKEIHQLGTSVEGPAAQLFIYNPWRRFEAWRFVSYMFVHVGVMHIMMNLTVQIFLGIALEVVHCWWRVALVYLAGVLAGSMGTSLVNPKTFLAGASAGVYALLTAHVATIIMNWKEMRYACAQFFIFLVFIITDIGTSIDRHINDPYDSVGYMAHLCGGIAGLLVGIGVLRNLEQRRFERFLWWFAVTVYFLLMIAGISVHIFYPEWFPQSKVYKNPANSKL